MDTLLRVRPTLHHFEIWYSVWTSDAVRTAKCLHVESSWPPSSRTEVPPVVREMVSRGDLGIKTGKGFYEWTPESGAALRRRIAEALVAVERLSESDGARDHEG